MGWTKHGGIWLLGWGFCAASAWAGFISELCPAGRWATTRDGQVVWVPEYVEVSAVAEEGPLELVIIDASVSPSRYGRIVAVLTLESDPATGRGPAVRVGAAGDWAALAGRFVGQMPAGTWTFWSDSLKTAMMGTAGTIQPRSLMLFDRPTGLSVMHGTIQQAEWGSAQLLDVVTVAPEGGVARAWGNEPVVQMNLQMALVRPRWGNAWDGVIYYRDGQPPGKGYLVGVPTVDGQLADVAPGYIALTPGAMNPVWLGHMPEPAGAVLMGKLLIILTLTRKKPDR